MRLIFVTITHNLVSADRCIAVCVAHTLAKKSTARWKVRTCSIVDVEFFGWRRG